MTKWKRYKNRKDEQLKNKGWFGMNTRTCWMVVEEEELLITYSLDYPGRVILIVGSYFQDTFNEKALDNTTLLHEVASCATEIPTTLPRVWPAKVANLPCNCLHCKVDSLNTACPYTP